MIQNGTYVSPADSSGVIWVNVFHLYYGYNRNVAYTGDFINSSIRETKPSNWLINNSNVKAIVIRTNNELIRFDGIFYNFNSNSAVLLNKRMTPYASSLFGPIPRTINRKNFVNTFPGSV